MEVLATIMRPTTTMHHGITITTTADGELPLPQSEQRQ
jgi:hypothetical protein